MYTRASVPPLLLQELAAVSFQPEPRPKPGSLSLEAKGNEGPTHELLSTSLRWRPPRRGTDAPVARTWGISPHFHSHNPTYRTQSARGDGNTVSHPEMASELKARRQKSNFISATLSSSVSNPSGTRKKTGAFRAEAHKRRTFRPTKLRKDLQGWAL